MSIKVDGITSEDELQKAQASAQAQGNTVTNYNEWSEILKNFEEYGIESTGSYAGDVAKMEEVKQAMEEYVAELEAQQVAQQNTPQNNDAEKLQESTKVDREQEMKATVANATSSQIMADYMKYYHLLM